MNKGIKVFLIISLSCIALGVMFLMIAVNSGASLTGGIGEISYVKHEPEIDFNRIEVYEASGAVIILPSDDDMCEIRCADTEKLYHKVTVDNGILSIRITDEREWFEKLFPPFADDSVKVYLPDGLYEKLYVETTSGSIKVDTALAFADAELISTSGGVDSKAEVTEELIIYVTSGGVTAENGKGCSMNIESGSGGVAISNSEIKELKAKCTSGGIRIDSVNVENDAEISNASGRISVSALIAGGRLNITNVSGRIHMEGSDAQEMNIENVSGGIDGSILTPKDFRTSSVSGSVYVEKSDPHSGRCDVSTVSGRINIQIEDN